MLCPCTEGLVTAAWLLADTRRGKFICSLKLCLLSICYGSGAGLGARETTANDPCLVGLEIWPEAEQGEESEWGCPLAALDLGLCRSELRL